MTEMSAEAVEARRAYQREYRRKNREKINAKRREWRANNKDKVRQCNERYWERIAEKKNNTFITAKKGCKNNDRN